MTGYHRISFSLISASRCLRNCASVIAALLLPLVVPLNALDPAENASPSLPEWVGLDFDVFTRMGRTTETYGLHRSRAALGVRHPSGIALVLEAQASLTLADPVAGFTSDRIGVQQAFVEYQAPATAWRLRVGRQEMAFGDERLIGADNEWCHLGQFFDAARVSYASERVSVDWFAAMSVSRVGLHGLYSTWQLPRNTGSLDAYAIWKSDGRAIGENGTAGRENRYTFGFLHTASLPGGLDTGVEIAAQAGRSAGEQVRAWAGHFEIGRQLWDASHGPRIAVEYNHASGDSNPTDGAQRQFDDLFPAGYDGFGQPDPFPWSNLHSLGVSTQWRVGDRLHVTAGMRALRPATGASAAFPTFHRAGQASFIAAFQVSHRWELYAGYSHLSVASPAALPRRHHTPFLGLRYRL